MTRAPASSEPARRERVVILGKTRMGKGVCIGGIVERTSRPVRLLPRGDYCHPPGTPFHVGEAWEMALSPRERIDPPHSEDHDEWDARKVGVVADLPTFVKQHARPHAGEPSGLFGGLMKFRSTGSGYLPRASPLPAWSVEFWLLPRPLTHYTFDHDHRYHMTGSPPLSIKHAGFETPVLVIPRGSLVRVSLARWWVNPTAPDEGETCSLQLSGWYGLPADAPRIAPPPPAPQIAPEDIPY